MLMGLLGLAISMYLTQFIQPQFEAKSDVLIETVGNDANNNTLQLMATFEDLVVSTRIINSVNKELEQPIEAKDLLKMVRIETGTASQLMTIYVTADNKEMAKKIANLFVGSFKKEINQHFTKSNVIILSDASISSTTDQQTLSFIYGIVGFILFSLVTYLLYLVKEIYRPKVDSEEKIELLNQQLLATLPTAKKRQNKQQSQLIKKNFQLSAPLIDNDNKNYPISILLIHQEVQALQQVAAGIAYSYSSIGKKPLIIEVNNENKSNNNARNYWSKFINGEIKLTEIIEKDDKMSEIDRLKISFSDQLDSTLVKSLQDELQQKYDVLLFTTNIKNKPYTFVLSQLIGQAIYIVNSKKMTMTEAEKDLKKLQQMNLIILGTVLIK